MHQVEPPTDRGIMPPRLGDCQRQITRYPIGGAGAVTRGCSRPARYRLPDGTLVCLQHRKAAERRSGAVSQ